MTDERQEKRKALWTSAVTLGLLDGMTNKEATRLADAAVATFDSFEIEDSE